ncbi:MAG: hypothetical protein HQK56_11705 [Deltaproteobacteria bacterium]|nr:hypothetical protein [Deltaproteobacteria bacterium]
MKKLVLLSVVVLFLSCGGCQPGNYNPDGTDPYPNGPPPLSRYENDPTVSGFSGDDGQPMFEDPDGPPPYSGAIFPGYPW